MIQDYFNDYLKRARYELIDDGTRFYAEIKELRGVWAVGKNVEECRQNLLSALEGWFVFRLRRNLPLPRFHFSGSLSRAKSYSNA